MFSRLLPLPLLALLPLVFSQLTIYTTYPNTPGEAAGPADTAPCISAGACDGRVLRGIANPVGDALTKLVDIRLHNPLPNGEAPTGMVLGRPVSGSFLGFSIELSVSHHIRACHYSHYPHHSLKSWFCRSWQQWLPSPPKLSQSDGNFDE
jgi:hypothetical protein